jgi:hypothetical protein
MANKRVTTVGLDHYAMEDAARLIDGIRALGTKASRDELVRALIWGTSAPQAVGMISAYIMHAHERETGGPGRM